MARLVKWGRNRGAERMPLILGLPGRCICDDFISHFSLRGRHFTKDAYSPLVIMRKAIDSLLLHQVFFVYIPAAASAVRGVEALVRCAATGFLGNL